MITIVVGALVLIGIFCIIKAYFFNPPKESPKQITQKIIDLVQKKNPTEQDKQSIRKYYKSSILEKFDKDMSATKDDTTDNSDGGPVVTIKGIDEQKNTATSTIEFDAVIIKVPVQFKFVKDGNFWTGYKWMINDVIGMGGDTNRKESAGKAEEKVDIGGNFALIVSQLSDYTPSDSYDRPDSGMKFVALEMTYFNNSQQSGEVSPSNLTLRDSDSHSYEITYKTEKTPELQSGTVVTPGTSAKGFVVYEIPTDAKIINAVYSNTDSTVTISF